MARRSRAHRSHNQSSSRKARRQLFQAVEALESRRMLAAVPIHQYSFTDEGITTLIDSIGNAHGQLLGNGGSLTGGQMVLPGGGSATAAYGDLPNGLISGLTDVTFEGWVTVTGTQAWARLFDFGSTAGGELTGPGGGGEGLDYIMTSAARGGDNNVQRTTIRNADPIGGGNANGNGEQLVDTSIPTITGQEFHFAVVFDADGGGGTASLTYYRDGIAVGSRDDVVIQLENLNDVNNWLGRSNWTGDANLQGNFNEFRIYDQAVSALDIIDSYNAGPDVSFGPKVPIHQYSFGDNGSSVLTDSIGGAHGALVGNGGQQTGGQLVLPGGASNTAAYGDLPNGLISGLTDVTFEGWATVTGSQNWGRLFDFGSTAGGELTGPGGGGEGLDYFMTSVSRGTDNNVQRTEIRNQDPAPDGSTTAQTFVDTSVPTAPGQEFHYAVVYDADGGGANLATITYYRNGIPVGSVGNVNIQLAQINDVNNWLGRSNWTGDANYQGSMNEFRIYDQVLSLEDIAASYAAGPDVSYGPAIQFPIHQYSFSDDGSTTLTDSIGGAHGELKGAGGQQAGGQLTLPGGSSATAAYGDLPNGLISALTDVTFEGWVTVDANQNWARLFDFGSSEPGEITGPGGSGAGLDYITSTASIGGDSNQQRTTIRNADPVGGGDMNGNNEQPVDTAVLTTFGQEFHFAVVFDADGGGQTASFTYYRDGINVGSRSDMVFQLENINDINNWLGRSNWTGDSNLQGKFNEFRIYNVALSEEAVFGSFARGPNVSFDPLPQIQDLDGDILNYQGGAERLDQDEPASVVDLDTLDFGGGSVVVAITNNGDPTEDVLSIDDSHADIQVSGNNIIHAPTSATTPVATISGGSNGNDLVVTFSTGISVGADAVSAILQSLSYENTDAVSPTALTRTVTITVTDPDSNAGTAMTTVRLANQPPTAVDDSGATDEDTILTVVDDTPTTDSLLTNDTDPNQDQLFVASFDRTSAMGAAVDVNSDGTFSYDPRSAPQVQALPGGATATDSFMYTVTDTADALAKPIHRWSFEEDGTDVLVDSIGGANGELKGTGGNLSGGQLNLPGGGSATAAYGDLPNGLISGLTDVTFEGWATVTGSWSWARLFDFGSTAGGELTGPGGGGEGLDYIMTSVSRGTDNNTQRTTIRNLDPIGGGMVSGTEQNVDTNIQTLLGEQFHYAVVFDANGGGNTASLTYYRNGVNVGSRSDVVIQLANINDVNNWLGRSNWTADQNFQGSFNEFRIYNVPLTAAQVEGSFANGPDASFVDPTAATVTIQLTGVNDAPVTPNVTRNTNEQAGVISVDLNPLVTDVDQGDTATITGLMQNQAQSDRDVSNDITFENNVLMLDTSLFADLRRGQTQIVVFDYSAMDTNNATSTGQITINVAGRDNAPRLQNVTFQGPIFEGSSATLVGEAIDPDAGTTLTIQIDWGDGTAKQLESVSPGSFTFSHIYEDDNPSGTPADDNTVEVAVVDYSLNDAVRPLHRYSFSGAIGELMAQDTGTDGTAHAQVQGLDGSALTGDGRVDLRGGSSAVAGYVDLPNGIISGLTEVTFEGWVSVESSQNWQRMFTFGSSTAGELTGPGGTGGGFDVLMLTANVGTNVNQQQMEIRNDDPVGGAGGTIGATVANDITPLAQDLWYAVVYDSDGNNGSPQLRYYREVNGVPTLRGTVNTNVQLANINDVNNWLGRSQWTGDANLDGKYNEFRIYDQALNENELNISFAAGPDTDYQQITASSELPRNRYSFAGTGGDGAELTDSIGGAHGVLRETDGVSRLEGGQMILGGGSSATAGYGDLPNGYISSMTHATFEGWISVDGGPNWGRVFDFGSTSPGGEFGELTGPGGGGEGLDYFMLSASRGTNVNQQRVEFRNVDPVGDGIVGATNFIDTNVPTTLGQEYHFTVTVTTNNDDQTFISSYRNGVLLASGVGQVSLSNLNDVNNWLGRSNWTGDGNMQGRFNEFRIYDQQIGMSQISRSFLAGPDADLQGGQVVTVTANVQNVPPSAGNLTASTSEDAPSAAINVLAGVFDPGAADTHTAVAETVSSSGGGMATINADGTAVYNPNGQFESLRAGATASDTFIYRIMDDDTGVGSGTVTVTITGVNDPPTAHAGGPYTVTEGGSLALDGSSSTDVDQGDTLTYSWDLNGDGVFGDATGVSPTVTWNQLLNLSPPINNGPAMFNVAVRVDDGSGPVTSPAVSLTVNNGPPTVNISGPSEAVPNFAVPLNLIASDPSPADQAAGFRYEVDFGDGTAPETFGPGAPGNQPVEHAFTSSGTFTVRVTAFDADGAASATALHTIRVIPIAQVGDDIIVGGSETLNDRIIIQSGRGNSIFVRVNNERFGPFDSVPTTVVRVFGGGGDDRITVSNCITTAIHGEAGNDYVAGGPCADEVHGGEGRDKILLGEGNNWGYGDGGNDYIAGRSGNDVMFGGAGNDVLLGGAGLDQLFGEGGNDLLSGGNQGDLLSGGLGNDRIDGGSGDDVAVGNIGNDQLFGGAGRDLLVGGSGRDALQGNEDQDRLIGGEAENDEDLDQLLTLALNWRLDGNTTSLGSLNDDTERDGLNGGSASDELFFGLDDVLTVGQEDVVTPM